MEGPFPGVRFVATGGIDADNAAAYLQAGARVVAVGSALRADGQVDRLPDLLGNLRSPGAEAARPGADPRRQVRPTSTSSGVEVVLAALARVVDSGADVLAA